MMISAMFTDESSIEIERTTTVRFHKQGEMFKPAPKPKHPLKVHLWGGISHHEPRTELAIFKGIMDAVLYCRSFLSSETRYLHTDSSRTMIQSILHGT